MKRLKKTIAQVKELLGIDSIPFENGASNFAPDEKAKLEKAMGAQLTQKVIDAIDKEANTILKEQGENTVLTEIEAELAEALKDTNISADEAVQIATDAKKADPTAPDAETISLSEKVQKLSQQLIEEKRKSDALVAKLIEDPEGDAPVAKGIVKETNVMKHSKTHLMATNNAYDAFDGRTWNQRAAGITKSFTDWAGDNGVSVGKLNQDMDHYFRENPESISSYIWDMFGLPANWKKIPNITHERATATITTKEITQGRKLPWLPKNEQEIEPEIGRIFPVQIDAQYVGQMLQDLEESWLSKFVGGGSQPYKTSFVAYLAGELNKQARIEDRISSVLGIHVKTPNGATSPGLMLSRQDGLLFQAWKAIYVDKKVKTKNIGTPTSINILDHVRDIIEKNLPRTVRDTRMPLELYMSAHWARAYSDAYRRKHGNETDFDGNTMSIQNFSNIKIVVLDDLAETDFMFITDPKNVSILENIPAEKSMYRFEYLLRMIYILGDYKLGIMFDHLGREIADNDPRAFSLQMLWTNGVPPFPAERFVPVFDDTSGKVKIKYPNLQVVSTWNTDITEITGTKAGMVVKIKGDSTLAAARNVKRNANLLLTATDFPLNTGGTLTLFVQTDGKLKELSRTSQPDLIVQEDVTFNTNIIDAGQGSDQIFNGTTVTTLAEIINGNEGQELKLTQTSTTALTINSVAGNLQVASEAVLDAVNDTISFVKVDGVWIETSRTIA